MGTTARREKDSSSEVKSDPEGEDTQAPSSDSPGSEYLHARAYSLYTQFRPDTGGEWGKRARFDLDKVLALRHGHESELIEYLAKQEAACELSAHVTSEGRRQKDSAEDGLDGEVHGNQELSKEIDRLVDEQERRDHEEELRAFASSVEETEQRPPRIKDEDDT